MDLRAQSCHCYFLIGWLFESKSDMLTAYKGKFEICLYDHYSAVCMYFVQYHSLEEQ